VHFALGMKKKSTILKKTRQLLLADGRPDYVIASLLGCSPSSIYNIRQSETESPGVLLVESLYELLAGKKIEL